VIGIQLFFDRIATEGKRNTMANHEQETVFLTGGTGFIGTYLTEMLLADGHRLKVLTRQDRPSPPPGCPPSQQELWNDPRVSLVQGDVTDPAAVDRLMEGCRAGFHMAGYAKNWSFDPQRYYRINVEGTRNVLEAAIRKRLRRLVFTSTIVTLGPTPRDVVGDETMPRITEHCFTEYEETKWLAEKDVLAAAKDGLPVVLVLPTRVYGPGHFSEGNALAQLIDEYRRGKAPILLNAGVNVGNYVLAEDVARGHYLALQKGRPGERYILGGENAKLGEFFRTIDRVTGEKHFKIPIFRPGALAFAYMQKLLAQWFGRYPRVTPGWVRTFLVDWAYSCEKAKKELDYRPATLEEGIRKTCRWLDALSSEEKP
jgi:farnesol dehydrogenase